MWFWLVSAIAGSIIGSATDSWFRDTKMGVWFYAKLIRSILGHQKIRSKSLDLQERKRMAKFPRTRQRLDSIESRVRLLEETGVKRDPNHNYQDSV